MKTATAILLLGLVLLVPPAPAGAGDAEESRPLMVVYAEGAVERLVEAAPAELLEIGCELSPGDRVALGRGAVLSIVMLEGPAAGHVVRLTGPGEGTVRELLEKAGADSTDGALGSELLEALRTDVPDQLEGPGVTRGAEKGPLRPVYPTGSVAAPCGPFVFFLGLDDLDGATVELRVFDEDPERGAEPILKKTVEGSPVELGDDASRLRGKDKLYWQLAAVMDGEELMAGEPARFELEDSPVGDAMPPQGFESPEARGTWHLMRARAFTKKRLYLDAWLEYGTLTAAGGGSSRIEKEQHKIERKLGLDEDDVAALRGLTSVQEPDQDLLSLTDGRELEGRIVSEADDSLIFASRGTRYQVMRSLISDVRRATRPKLASAAPFVTFSSRRYHVSANTDREFAEEAARHLEALFDAFARTFGRGLGARNAKNLKAIIYRDETDFRAYVKQSTARSGAAGFYDFADTTLYLFRRFEGDRETTWNTLYHEGVHQILHLVCNQDPDITRLSHFWIAEAIPTWCESFHWEGDRLEPGTPETGRVQHFLRLKAAGSLDALPRFFGRTQAEFAGAEQYAQGVAVLDYLLNAEGGKYRNAFFDFAKDVFQNRPRDRLEEKAFRRPLAEIAEGYADWFEKQYGG